MSNCNENKINLILLMFIGILLWILPFGVNAAGEPYEVGVKFYEVGEDFDPTYTELWFNDYKAGYISELSDTELKPGTTFVLGLTLKTVDTTNANATAFALYLEYDASLLEVPSEILENDIPSWFDNRASDAGGIFPSRRWSSTVLNSDNPGEITATFGDKNSTISNRVAFNNTEEGAAIFFFLKVKDDAKAGETITFDWITEEDNPSNGLYTMGSTKDAVEVAVKTNNSSVLSVYKEEVVIDATLSELTVKDDTTNYVLDPEFQAGSGGNTYNVIVAPTVEKVTIAAAATAGADATFSGTGLGEKTLNVGPNTYEFTVTADGDVQVYIVIVTKLSGVATLEDLSLSNATLNETFESTNLKYTANVPYQTKETEVSATATSPATIKSGTGTVSLAVGNTPISVVVEAENCDAKYVDVPNNVCASQTYEVTVTRSEPSSDATLKELKVNNTKITLVDGDYDYEIDAVGSGVNSVDVVADTTHDYAKAVTTGNTGLAVGENIIEITVTAEDGSTKQIYTVKVVKKSNDATLKELHVTSDPQGNLDKDFNANTTEYTYYYDETVKTIHVEGVANSTTIQSITPAADYTIGEDTEAKIVVVPEDGAEKTYTITFERKKSTVSTLDSLTVKNGETEYGVTLESGKFEYTVTVPHEVDKVQISGKTTSDNITSVTGFEEISLGFTEVEHKVVVTAEDTSAKTEYVIKITREKSDNAYLKEIKIGGNLIAGFVKENLTYTLDDVSSGTSKLDISYTKDNEYSTVTIEDNTLVEGQDNVVKIKVKSQDETVEKEYLLTVRRKSSDATLKELHVTSDPQGNLDKDFSADTTKYIYYYDETVKTVHVEGVANSTTIQSITPAADYTIGEDTEAKIVVVPEDGAEKTYTITFERKKSTVSTLDSLTVKNGETEYGVTLESGKFEYTVTVPHEVDKVQISGETTSDNITSVTGFEEISLGFTEVEHKVVVTAEDGDAKTEYVIKITREMSDNAYLREIKIGGVSIAGFVKENLIYTLDDVSSGTSKLDISYTKDNEYSTVTIEDNTLVEGQDNVVKIKVKSQDETVEKEYLLTVRRKSSDAKLKGITVTSDPQGYLDKDFEAGTTEYTYYYDRTVKTINVSVEKSDAIALVTGEGNYTIGRDTKAEIVVTPEDGTINTYVVNFVQILEEDSTLKSLTVSNGGNVYGVTLESGKFEYTVSVLTEVDKITIDAEANGSFVKSIEGLVTDAMLDYGDNVFKIKVTAEDESKTSTYTITIDRAVSEDASLTNLLVDNVQVPDFKPEELNYTLNAVAYTKDEVTITATGVAGTTIEGDGDRSLAVGNNTLDVVVTAADGTTKVTYKINIYRKSNDATLTGLTVTSTPSGTLEPDFAAGTKEYTLTIPADVETITVNPTPAPGAKITNLADLANISVNGLTEVKVEVEAEDSNYTDTYVIKINQLASSNNNLKSLVVKDDDNVYGVTLESGTFRYTINVDKDVDFVYIEAEKEHSDADVDGDIGRQDLEYGENEFIITVTAEDNTPQDYTVVINRAKNNDNSITSLKVFGQTATWDATNNKYIVIVDNANAALTADNIDAVLPEGATIDKGTGMSLVEGINTYTVTVKAQDGTEATYTIEIFRKGSVTELLTNLTIYGETPTWNASLSQYELTVENSVATLAPTDIEATVPTGATLNKGDGKDLVVGANEYEISVTLADGTFETYNIVITRRGSSANTLSGLTIYGETPTWNADLLQYELTVENTTTTLEPTDIEATVPTGATLDKGEGMNLEVGANEYEISVTAEDGTEAEYKIVITREGLDIPTTITSTQYGHTITDDYIMTVKEKATASQLKNQLDNDNQYLEIWTADDARMVQDSEVLATGMIVKLKIGGVEYDRKYIVIKGDTDGNGEIDLFDAMKILNDYLNRVKLSGAYLEAGYVNEGTDLDLFDAMGILNHYLGRVKLH